MNAKVNTFLNTNLLEKYLIGGTTTAETKTVEDYINTYQEVKIAYNELQDNLELVSQANAVEAPKNILDTILNEIDEKPVIPLLLRSKKHWFNLTIAASIATLIFAGSSFVLYNQNQKLSQENQVVVDEIFDLRSDINQNNKRLDDLMQQFLQLNNPETEKYILKGNLRAKNLKTVAYINPKEKTSMIDVVSLPILPPEKCYQIWADMQGKMVSLGILTEADRRLQAIPYTEDALGLAITIEPKGGSLNASTDTPVAEIELKLGD